MSRRTRTRILAMVAMAVMGAGLLIGVPGAASAQSPEGFDCASDLGDPEPGTPEWDFAWLDTQWCRTERPAITDDNLAYDAALAANDAAGSPAKSVIPELGIDGFLVYDPFRDVYLRWAGIRGDLQEVTYKDSTGTPRKALLQSPLNADTSGPLPAVLLPCHTCTVTFLHEWQWAAESLAENGYVVMYADIGGSSVDNAIAATDYLLSTPESPSPQGEVNPWHARIDPTRVGIMGHSGAARVALVAGNVDERFDALVAWDPGSGIVDAIPTLQTPSMVQVRDLTGPGDPPAAKPVPDPGSRYTIFDAFKAAGIDTMQVAPRGSTHADWLGVGCWEPIITVQYDGCTKYGEAVATYYTLAWFDRYLAGATPEGPTPPGEDGRRRAIAIGALRRLTEAQKFDASGDAYAISTGFFDQQLADQAGNVEAGNVPFEIKGLSVRNRLSFWYPTRYFLEGGALACEDVRGAWPPGGGQGCAVAPQA